MTLSLWGLWVGVQGAGSRVNGSGCRVQGAGCRVHGSGFRVRAGRETFGGFTQHRAGAGNQVQGFQGLGCRVHGSRLGLGHQGLTVVYHTRFVVG